MLNFLNKINDLHVDKIALNMSLVSEGLTDCYIKYNIAIFVLNPQVQGKINKRCNPSSHDAVLHSAWEGLFIFTILITACIYLPVSRDNITNLNYVNASYSMLSSLVGTCRHRMYSGSTYTTSWHVIMSCIKIKSF